MEYQHQDTIDMYRWLVGNRYYSLLCKTKERMYLRLWSVQEPASSFEIFSDKSIHHEEGTANREIAAKHLAYTLLYMFLVAEI